MLLDCLRRRRLRVCRRVSSTGRNHHVVSLQKHQHAMAGCQWASRIGAAEPGLLSNGDDGRASNADAAHDCILARTRLACPRGRLERGILGKEVGQLPAASRRSESELTNLNAHPPSRRPLAPNSRVNQLTFANATTNRDAKGVATRTYTSRQGANRVCAEFHAITRCRPSRPLQPPNLRRNKLTNNKAERLKELSTVWYLGQSQLLFCDLVTFKFRLSIIEHHDSEMQEKR